MRGHIAERVGKDGIKRFYAVYYHDGKTHWKTAGPSKKKAQAILAKVISQIDDGEYRELKAKSFDDFARGWLEGKRSQIKASTYRQYDGHIRVSLIPFFGQKPLKKIDYKKCKEFVGHELKAGKNPLTVKKYLVTLKGIFKEAVREGYLKQSPALYVDPPRGEKKRHDILTAEETQRFLEAVDPYYYPVFLTLVLTGARVGEVLGLPWRCLDLKGSAMSIEQILHDRKIQDKPKTSSSIRTIALPQTLVDVLRSLQIQALRDGRLAPDNLVFVNTAGGPVDGTTLNRVVFRNGIKTAGITKDTRPHDLRHAFASTMLAMGEDVAYIAEQMGHSTPFVTLSTYSHAIKQRKHETADKISQVILGSKVRSI